MFPYRPGDVIRVYNYPFIPKKEQEKMRESNPDLEHDISEGKERYGIVINSGGSKINTIPVFPVTSRSNKTEKDDYKLRRDEVRVPDSLFYKKGNINKKLYGVIKTERIENFYQDEVSAPLTQIPLRTKIELSERYNDIVKNSPYRLNELDETSPNHKIFMNEFRDSVIAEKLDFLVTNHGERKYDKMQKSNLSLDKIQPLGKIGKSNRISVYSVQLKGKIDSFTYTIATLKNDKQIAKDWKHSKPAKEWMKEDFKYTLLKNNMDQELRPNPIITSNKFIDFTDFHKNVNQHIKKDNGLNL